MRISERRLRRLIRQELEEGFFSRITDPKRWKEFGKRVKDRKKQYGGDKDYVDVDFDDLSGNKSDSQGSTPTYDDFKKWLENNLDARRGMLFITFAKNVKYNNPREMREKNIFEIRDKIIFPSLKKWLNIKTDSSTHRMVDNFLYLVSNAILSPICKNFSGVDKKRTLKPDDQIYFGFICGFLRDYRKEGIELKANDPEIEDIYKDLKMKLGSFMEKYNF